MEPLNTPRKRRLVPAVPGPQVMASVGGQWIKVRTEKVGRSSLFLIADAYVPPRVVFELRISMEADAKPLRVLATASYVERTEEGYGIAVEFSSLATDDQRRWDRFSGNISVLRAATVKSGSRLRPAAAAQRSSMLIMADALLEPTVIAMRKIGVPVETVPTLKDALARVQTGEVKMVVADLPGGTAQGPELVGRLLRANPSVLSVLFTDRGDAAEFEACIQAGATMIVGKPCGQKLLTTRLLALFNRKPLAAK